MVALGTILVVGLADLIRIAFLSGGGKVVAESWVENDCNPTPTHWKPES